jgi:hypothetical protein
LNDEAMMRPFPISQPELLRRRVLFAVALTDPLTGALVSSGIRVFVDKLESPPIINQSGHFVWLAENGGRPTTVTIDPDGAPYEADSVPVPALPDPPLVDPAQPAVPIDDSLRRQVIFLRPSAAYPFPDGATVVRGKMQETAASDAAPIAGAAVAIEWFSEKDPNNSTQHWVRSFTLAKTDSHGEFAAALALPVGARAAVQTHETIELRLRFDRAGAVRVSEKIALPPPDGAPYKVQRNTVFLDGPVAWDQLQAP